MPVPGCQLTDSGEKTIQTQTDNVHATLFTDINNQISQALGTKYYIFEQYNYPGHIECQIIQMLPYNV